MPGGPGYTVGALILLILQLFFQFFAPDVAEATL